MGQQIHTEIIFKRVYLGIFPGQCPLQPKARDVQEMKTSAPPIQDTSRMTNRTQHLPANFYWVDQRQGGES